jgi:hypothetical protein
MAIFRALVPDSSGRRPYIRLTSGPSGGELCTAKVTLPSDRFKAAAVSGQATSANFWNSTK